MSKSPFMRRIEQEKLPRRFHQPTFTIYNGKTDPVEHVSHFNQRMVVHSKDEALMCKVFPSNLGPVAMRWFDSLKADSINSFRELTHAFGSRFVTCQRVAKPLASLLSLSMQEGETLKTYSDRYWEMISEMEDDCDGVAVNMFKPRKSIPYRYRPVRTVPVACRYRNFNISYRFKYRPYRPYRPISGNTGRYRA
ncbi:uncharacterized protein LOC136063379 [Quercus suber]|uniref:uncharacterized protein LOC136063379 n=1 Tax=Quercus suber TaxID=58331 RepID=UPI0032DF7B56